MAEKRGGAVVGLWCTVGLAYEVRGFESSVRRALSQRRQFSTIKLLLTCTLGFQAKLLATIFLSILRAKLAAIIDFSCEMVFLALYSSFF